MLFAIGGNLDCTKERHILHRLLSEAHGIHSRVCVITTASEQPETAVQLSMSVFADLGVKNCVALPIQTVAEANDPGNVQAIQDADIVFFMGGDQLKLSRAFIGTKCMDAINKKFQEGGIIAGTSAGAAAISKQMIYGKKIYEDGKFKEEKVDLYDGLGLSEGIIVDMHFTERNRLARLFAMVAQNPTRMGIGVDEDTAAILKDDGTIEVLGAGTVTIIDGFQAAAAKAQGNMPHIVLKSGDRYDLNKRIKIEHP